MDTKKKVSLASILFLLMIINAYDGNMINPTLLSIVQMPLFMACVVLIFEKKR